MPTRVVVVEDDPDIAALVALYLRKADMEVEAASNGREGLALITATPPDCVVLDLMLPQMNGLELTRLIRTTDRTRDVPIVMLTARAEESDRIVGLELGADDYLAKPFSPAELVARVRAVLRRARRTVAEPDNTITYGPLVVDKDRHTVVNDRALVALTAKEFLLLEYLLRHRGRVVSRDTLLSDVWGYRYTGGTRTVDVHVRRLREKLPLLTTALQTVKQFGYRIADTPETPNE